MGKIYFRESELLEFNKISPKSLLITQEKNIELFENHFEYEKLINLSKLNKLNTRNLIYLGKLSKALESGNYKIKTKAFSLFS